MRHSARDLQYILLEGKHKRQSRKRRPDVERLEERALLSAVHHLTVNKLANDFGVTYLVSDIKKMAMTTDKNLLDPWQIRMRPAR
jgi:aminoglycoside/choline kinase family phosphotransferase